MDLEIHIFPITFDEIVITLTPKFASKNFNCRPSHCEAFVSNFELETFDPDFEYSDFDQIWHEGLFNVDFCGIWELLQKFQILRFYIV